MAQLILDTNIVSYFFKGDPRAAAYLPDMAGRTLCISFATLGELYQWPILRSWGSGKIASLEIFVERYEVIWSDELICRYWAEITTLKGRPVSLPDAWIAATAMRQSVPLLSHNRKNFEQIPGLELVTH